MRLMQWCAVLWCLCAGSQLAQAENIEFRGVEIGSNGVKSVSLIFNLGKWETFDKGADKVLPAEVLVDAAGVAKQLGLVASGFKDTVVTNVADVTKRMLDMTPESVPADRKFVVISSGVVAAAAKDENSTQELARLKSMIKEQTQVDAVEITVGLEVQNSFDELLGSTYAANSSDAILIDIGGGNTKFGTYLNGKFVTGEIPHGVAGELKSFEQLKTPEEFQNAINKLRDTAAAKIRVERTRVGLDKIKPQNVYLLGGAFFSLMAHAQPADLVPMQDKQPDPEFATVNPGSLALYQAFVATGNNDLPPVIAADLNAGYTKRAQERAALARKIIGVGQRRPAQALIEAVYDAFDLKLPESDTVVKFPVNGNYAWLMGYVRKRASKDSYIAMLFWIGEQFRKITTLVDDRHAALIRALADNAQSPMPSDELATKIADSVSKSLEKAVKDLKIPEVDLDELTKKIVKDLKVPALDADALLKKLADNETFQEAITKFKEELAKAAKPDLDELAVKTAEKVNTAIVDELAPKLLKELKIPTAAEIAKEVNSVKADELAKELLDKLKIPTAEEIAKLVTGVKAEELAQELKAELKDALVKDIAAELKDTLAQDIADKLKIPTAKEIADAVSSKIPSAKEIAAELTIPTADDIGSNVKVPSAKEIGSEVKVPTAAEIAMASKIPTPEEIASLIKVPTAAEIASKIKLPDSNNGNCGVPETIWTTVYDACGRAFFVPRTIYKSNRGLAEPNFSASITELKNEIARSEARLEKLVRDREVSVPQTNLVAAESSEAEPEDTTPREQDPQAASRAFQQGRDDYDHQQNKAALSLLIEATQLDTKESLYWYYRSLAEVRLGKHKQAQASAQRVAELSENSDSRAKLYQRLERVQGSERQTVQRYIANGSIALGKTAQLRSLTR